MNIHPRSRSMSVSVIVVVLALLVVALHPAQARAADPGEFLLDSSGTLQPKQKLPIEFYSGGPANLRLQVSGGAAGDSVRVTLQGSDTSWSARSGETVWGYATLPQQNGSLLVENMTDTPLTYALKAYALDVAPSFGEGVSTLTGVAQGPGSQSAAQIVAPANGLYRFTLGANAGSYQLNVDNGLVVKTVVAGATPSSDDTLYFLNAGTHTLRVIQNAGAASTEWSVAVTPVGGNDALPTAEQTAQLGGPAFFTEERIPLQLASAQAVNVRVAATGGASDSLSIELYNGADKVYTSSPVFGGEVAWGSAGLAAGANTLRVVAKDGNKAALAYTIQIVPVGQAPLTWEGVSYGSPQHGGDGLSQIQMTFPASGLYRFTSGASAGRYQLVLNNTYLRKTVTTAGVDFTAFVPAGTQTLVVVQDPAAAQTTWSVAVAPANQPQDVLPFSTKSGTLGGAGNAFREEWIPVQVAAGTSINMRVAATGAAADALTVEVYNGDSKVYGAPTVYGTEVFWGNTTLAQGKNLVHIVAAEGNANPMAYELQLNGVASIPAGWSGTSRGAGLKSSVTLNAPISGTYIVTVTIESGAGQVHVDPATPATRSFATRANGTVSVLRVPLSAGPHSFVFQQDAAQESTNWSIATSLRKPDQTVAISNVTPGLVSLGQAPTVTVTGQGFGTDAVVALVGPNGAEIAVSGVAVVSASELRFTLPANLPKGSYGVKVTSGGKTEVRATAITIGNMRVFVPIVRR